MLGLCLVAALALGAYAVSSASALEWGKCEFVGSGGNYTGPNCNKAAGEKAKPKGSGEYEYRKASEVAEKRVTEGKTANVPFTGGSVEGGGLLTSGGRACEAGGVGGELLRTTRQGCAEAEGTETGTANGEEGEPLYVECAAETNTGEAEGKNKVSNVNVVFTGCAAMGAIPCTNTGVEGEIKTAQLKGKLGWISKANKEVGVMLEPVQHHGSFAEFNCPGFIEVVVGVGNKKEGTEYVKGTQYPEGCNFLCPGATPEEEKHGGYDEIISPITPVNTMTNEFTQEFTIEKVAPFKNIPDSFERKHLSVLEDYFILGEFFGGTGMSTSWMTAGEVITNVNTPEEEGEIKA